MATHTVASASQGDKLSFFAEIQIIFGTVQEPRDGVSWEILLKFEFVSQL